MKYLIRSLLLFPFFWGYSQKIFVKDAVTHEVLAGVVIVDKTKNLYTTTDVNGEAQLAEFDNKTLVSFTHMGYTSQRHNMKNLKPNQVIWMSPNAEQLGEIVLSVSRSTEKKQRLAQQIGVLTSQQIEKQYPENTATLLREVPGVRVQQSQGGGGSPVLRGFEANRVLLVVDGVRMNNAIFRSGHLHNSISIDPLSLSRAEVIFGPSSVGYGSDALGGVIHFYTKTPLINQKNTFRITGSSSYTFTQNTSKQTALFEYSAPKWAMLQQVSYSEFGDVVMGSRRPHGYDNWGKVFAFSQNTDTRYATSPAINNTPNVQRNSGYHQLDMLQKWVYHTTNGVKLTLNVQGSQSGNIPRFDKLSETKDNSLRFARWEYGPQKRLLLSPQISFVGNRPWLRSGKIIAAVQLLEESRIKRKFSSLNRETQIEQLAIYSLNADFKAQTKAGKDWSYGLEYTQNQVRSRAFAQEVLLQGENITGLLPKRPIPTRYPSGGSTYATLAAYLDYRYDLNPKSTLTLGARHTITELNAEWTEQALIDARLARVYQKHQASNVTLGYTYQPNTSWQLKALFSTGFRAPNIDDLGKTREDKGVLTVPNMWLKPEFIYSFDIGIRKQWQNNSFVELNGYYAFVQDYIARAPYTVRFDKTTDDVKTIKYDGDVVETAANVNVGEAQVGGLSAETKWQITPKVTYRGTLTFTRGFGNELSGNLPSISPVFITQKILWNLFKGDVSLQWHHAQAKSPEHYSSWGEDGLEETPVLAKDTFAGTPAWHRWDMQFSYPLSNAMQLSGGIFNLWDTHYREFASGISAPGRSIKLVIRYRL